jgi:hypothetical protein
MAGRAGRRPTVPIRGLPPLLASTVAELCAAVQAPVIPPWEDFVESAVLRRYFTRVWESPGFEATFAARVDSVAAASRSTRIADYLPYGPLLKLRLLRSPQREQLPQRRSLPLATVRGYLVECLLAIATVGPKPIGEEEGGTWATRLVQAATGAEVASSADAWIWMFGADWAELLQELDQKDSTRGGAAWREYHGIRGDTGQPERLGRRNRPTKEASSSIAPARGVTFEPYVFLNWAWAQHRKVDFSDFVPYGLDDVHWAVLTDEEPCCR